MTLLLVLTEAAAPLAALDSTVAFWKVHGIGRRKIIRTVGCFSKKPATSPVGCFCLNMIIHPGSLGKMIQTEEHMVLLIGLRINI